MAYQSQITPQTNGLGFQNNFAGYANLFSAIAPSIIGLLEWQQTKKANEDNRKKTMWEAAQQAKAANNKLKWSKGLQNSLEGKQVGAVNERQAYDSLVL